MKKIYIVLFIIFTVLFWHSQKLDMDNVVKKPNFTGTVEKVSDSYILVAVDSSQAEFEHFKKLNVSRDAKLEESIMYFSQGDTVKVYYDGRIKETSPARIDTVYAITLINPTSPQ